MLKNDHHLCALFSGAAAAANNYHHTFFIGITSLQYSRFMCYSCFKTGLWSEAQK